MRETRVRLNNALGLHARAAAQLVHLARGFESRIILSRTETTDEVNARSILGLLGLSASQGVELDVSADGSDENDAITAVTKLFEDRFGEHE